MAKVAKLVMVSLMTRVIVDHDATEEKIMEAAKEGFRAKIDNDELIENIEEIRYDVDCPFGKIKRDFNGCPVCNRISGIRLDYDSPDSMSCCDNCGAEWIRDNMEVTLDPRDELSPDEIDKRRYNKL